MQISRRILIACATTVIVFPILLQAAETEAQIKARQALEEKMTELATQPVTPAPAKPAAPQVKPVEPKEQKPLAPAAPVATVAQPAPGIPVFAPVPQASPTPESEKAHEALRQKMSELEQKPVVSAEPSSAKPVFQTLPGDASSATATTVVTNPKSKKVKADQQEPASAKPVVTVKSSNGFQPMQGPPTGFSAAKEQRLQQLLQDYRSDKLSPDEYHIERAKVLAEP